MSASDRRAVVLFFLVGFGVPWLGWSTIALLDLPPSPTRTALFYTGDFMSVAGLVAAYAWRGPTGLGDLLRKVVLIRAPIGWALFAIFIPITWIAASRVVQGVESGFGRFEPAGLLTYVAPSVLVALTTGPIGEEPGWRGFFLPWLVRRYRPLAASLVLGFLWGIWHYPLYVNSVFSTIPGAVGFTLHTMAFSVLFTVLWAATNGSVFWAIVLHYTINITPRVFDALFPELRPRDRLIDPWEIGALLVVAVISWIIGRKRIEALAGEPA
jgi:uncharacterized protein